MRKPIPHRERPSPQLLSVFEELRSAWERVAVVSALAYALGYVSRAIHAWDFNFGALPGARFDYLMAGVFLSIPVAGLAAALFGARNAVLRLNSWAKSNRGSAQRWQKRVLVPLIVASVAYLLAKEKLWFLAIEARGWIAIGAVFTFVLAVILTGVLLPDGDQQSSQDRASGVRDSISSWLGSVISYVVTGYFGLLLVLAFAIAALLGAELLAKWPQELGGVKAKCGVLDLAVEKLSPEMLSLLVPSASNMPPALKVARSHQLEVFSTSGPWLIRTPEPGASAPLRRSIRLPNEVVLSVEWVASATPLPSGNRPCQSL